MTLYEANKVFIDANYPGYVLHSVEECQALDGSRWARLWIKPPAEGEPLVPLNVLGKAGLVT